MPSPRLARAVPRAPPPVAKARLHLSAYASTNAARRCRPHVHPSRPGSPATPGLAPPDRRASRRPRPRRQPPRTQGPGAQRLGLVARLDGRRAAAESARRRVALPFNEIRAHRGLRASPERCPLASSTRDPRFDQHRRPLSIDPVLFRSAFSIVAVHHGAGPANARSSTESLIVSADRTGRAVPGLDVAVPGEAVALEAAAPSRRFAFRRASTDSTAVTSRRRCRARFFGSGISQRLASHGVDDSSPGPDRPRPPPARIDTAVEMRGPSHLHGRGRPREVSAGSASRRRSSSAPLSPLLSPPAPDSPEAPRNHNPCYNPQRPQRFSARVTLHPRQAEV